NPSLDNPSFEIVRYLPAGDIDASFGTEGSTTTSSKDFLYCTDALLQNDGKLLVAGGTYTNTFAFARYINDDKTQKQIFIAKIRRWLQHHNGIVWDNMPGVKSYAVQRSADGVRWATVYRSPLTVHRQLAVN